MSTPITEPPPGEPVALSGPPQRPTVVCLCGSTRFRAAFAEANQRETLAGRIVLTIGVDLRANHDLLAGLVGLGGFELDRVKARLDELHKQKIDLADEILVLNVDGYIGDSTRSEIEYAERAGKGVRYLEPQVYVIWSNRHQLWWRAKAAGYTADVRWAGRYTEAAALTAITGPPWLPDQPPPEVLVPARVPELLGLPGAEGAMRLHARQLGEEAMRRREADGGDGGGGV